MRNGGTNVEESLKYKPEYNLLQDAYLGSKDILQNKLTFLAKMAQEEKWDYKGTSEKQIFMYILLKIQVNTKRKGRIGFYMDLSSEQIQS